MLIITAVFPGEMLSDLAFQIVAIDEKSWTNEMLRVPVYSRVLKMKNVNKKGLCWQAKIAKIATFFELQYRLTLETSAKHHTPQATNIPYQPC